MKTCLFTVTAIVLLIVLIACSPLGNEIPSPMFGTLAAKTGAAIQATRAAGFSSALATPPIPTPTNRNPTMPISQQVENLLAQMTLEEKIGQMTQVEKNSIKPDDVTACFIGSVLSGGDGAPQPNDPLSWIQLVKDYQAAALKTRLGIPILYGVDAVHGFGIMNGATVFPHNVALGATRDADLVRRIARATAEEMAGTGIYWNFAPCIAAPQDVRWGRTYEGYGENFELVSQLGVAYIRGLQDQSPMILATPKHFIGDGGTMWGTSRIQNFQLDQGDLQIDEATLRAHYLPAYQAAIDAGAKSVMVSYSSWNGVKMHAHQKLITDVLKGELGFKGFVVSDWQGIDQVAPIYDDAIVTSINAGIDMVMVPYAYQVFIDGLTRAVKNGRVPMSRIDDAVRRILTVKFEIGLFDHPFVNPAFADTIGSDAHRQLAREAVRKSLVLLENDNQALPLAKGTPLIYVSGAGANDLGFQSGGWTLEWQGTTGNTFRGTTILDGIRQVSPKSQVDYSPDGNFSENIVANVGIVVLGEAPYAEGRGDRADLSLPPSDLELIDRVKSHSKRVIVILISGRPLTITDALPKADALVAAWLPGSEGAGVADVLFGDFDFTGKLPYTWQRFNTQLPIHSPSLRGCGPLFPYGYGLSLNDSSSQIPYCPGQ